MEGSGRTPSGARRVLGVLAALVVLALVGAGGWWAGRATLAPQSPMTQEAVSGPVWAQATQGSVGRSLSLSTTLRQPSEVIAGNQVAGVVTQVNPGEVDVGDVAYVVGDTDVRVVSGDRPFFRDLGLDSVGWDVEQLQAALVELGYLDGAVDGEFGASTEAAVQDWQEEREVAETGAVLLGELVAVPMLPTVINLGESIVTGQSVGGGEEAVLAPTGEQQFVLVITPEQTRLIPAEATVEVSFEEQTWPAVVAGATQDEVGSTELELTAPGGGPVCGRDCASLPGDEQVTLRSKVILVPTVEGVGVPAAAVSTQGDGTTSVVTDSGTTEVTVLGSGQGVVIVEGLEVGTRVQVQTGAPGAGTVPGDGAPETQEP